MYTTDMTELAAKQICSWSYEKPYDVYNYPSYENALKSNEIITQKEHSNKFICFWDDNNILLAYIRLMHRSNQLFLGIGLAPDCCGQGAGKFFLLKGIEAAQEKYGKDVDIHLQVRSWNKRAIKCYSSCGFEVEYQKSELDKSGQIQDFCYMKLKH